MISAAAAASKTVFAAALLVAAAITTSCKETCPWRAVYSRMDVQRAEMTAKDVALTAGSEPVASADLRLKMFCVFTVEYSPTPGELNCEHHTHYGLRVPMHGLTLTCDRDVAGIPAGQDLIATMNPLIYHGTSSYTVPQWLSSLHGSSANSIMPGMTYEYDLVVVPYYVTVEPGSYVFTVKLTSGYEYNEETVYSRTFPAVRIK